MQEPLSDYSVVSTILSVILFESFSYSGDCYTDTFFFFPTSQLFKKVLVEIESSHCMGGALTLFTLLALFQQIYRQRHNVLETKTKVSARKIYFLSSFQSNSYIQFRQELIQYFLFILSKFEYLTTIQHGIQPRKLPNFRVIFEQRLLIKLFPQNASHDVAVKNKNKTLRVTEMDIQRVVKV